MRSETPDIFQELRDRFADSILSFQSTRDGIATVWVQAEKAHDVLRYLKNDVRPPYKMLYDLTAIDERERVNREGQPPSDFTVVYHLLSFDRNADIRVKIPLKGETPSIRTITDIWSSSNWYEREVWDMFGIRFEGHPLLKRILLPPWWEGHPLRREHHARATERPPFSMPEAEAERMQATLEIRPEEWGMTQQGDDLRRDASQLWPAPPRNSRRSADHPSDERAGNCRCGLRHRIPSSRR